MPSGKSTFESELAGAHPTPESAGIDAADSRLCRPCRWRVSRPVTNVHRSAGSPLKPLEMGDTSRRHEQRSPGRDVPRCPRLRQQRKPIPPNQRRPSSTCAGEDRPLAYRLHEARQLPDHAGLHNPHRSLPGTARRPAQSSQSKDPNARPNHLYHKGIISYHGHLQYLPGRYLRHTTLTGDKHLIA